MDASIQRGGGDHGTGPYHRGWPWNFFPCRRAKLDAAITRTWVVKIIIIYTGALTIFATVEVVISAVKAVYICFLQVMCDRRLGTFSEER